MLPHYLVLVLVLRVTEGRFLRKPLMSLGEIEETFHLKLFAIIVDKGHIRPFYHVRNIQVPNCKMT